MSQIILYPSGNGDEKNQVAGGPDYTNNYNNVKEHTPDDLTSFNYADTTGTYKRDLYAMDDCGLPVGTTINFIDVYMRILCPNGDGKAKTAIKSGGAVYDGSEETGTSSWVNKYTHYTTIGGAAITPAMLDAIQAGCSLKQVSDKHQINNTQTYILVDYTASTAWSKTLTESIKITEAFSRVWVVKRTLTESVKITESFLAYFILVLLLQDSIKVTESLIKGIGKKVSDGIKITESLIKHFIKKFTDTIKITEVFSSSFVLFLNLIENIKIVDIIKKTFIKTLIDRINIHESIIAKMYWHTSDAWNGSLKWIRNLLTDTVWTNTVDQVSGWIKGTKKTDSWSKGSSKTDGWTKTSKKEDDWD